MILPQMGSAPETRWKVEPENRVTQMQLSAPDPSPRWFMANPIECAAEQPGGIPVPYA